MEGHLAPRMVRTLGIALATVLLGVGPTWAAHLHAGWKLKTPPIVVRPHGDADQWTVVRVPSDEPIDITGMDTENRGVGGGFGSHHLRVYAARPNANFASLSRYQHHWLPTFSQLEYMDLVGGSQTIRKHQVAAQGLALHLPVASYPGRKRTYVWLAINSHWVNGTDTEHKGRLKVTLLPAAKPVRRYLKAIFEGSANAGLSVPQHTIRSTEDSTRELNEKIANLGLPLTIYDAWGPSVFSAGALAVGSGALPPPAGPACVTLLTAHMHLRGKLFAVDFIDTDDQVKNGEPTAANENPYEPGRHHLFVSRNYEDPAEMQFDPARYVVVGQRFHYACWHDNGVDAPPKLTCEDIPGVVPGVSIGDGFISGVGGSSGFACHQEGANGTECPTAWGLTGQCVRANLVFGPLGDDDMCILPGAYYDPNPDAPAGHECDLSLMPPLS